MNVSPLGPGSPVTRLQGSKATNGTPASQDVRARAQDTVEISDMARYLGEIKKLPDVRQDKVDAVRQAIASDGYESPEKIDAVVGGLLNEWA